MKVNRWTLGLGAAGVVSLASVVQAEEAAKHAVSTALSATTLSGYVDTSAIWRFGTGNGLLPGRSYDQANVATFGPSRNKQDGFNLNVVKLTLEKPLDEGQWAAGYKVDLLFGPDAGTFAVGSGQPVTGNFVGNSAVKQAYVALRAPVGNGLDFKIGVWDTIIGYEVFDAGSNPNYSRSYGYFLEPTTYTGILASYRVNDIVSLSAGVADPGGVNARNTQGGGESIKAYMASIALTAPQDLGFLKGSTLYAGVIDNGRNHNGNPLAGGTATGDGLNIYTGGTIATPITGLSLGAAYDYFGTNTKPNTPVFSSANSWANAVSMYASFKATDKLTLNGRGEYTWAQTGFYSAGPGGTHVNAESDKFFAATATADYALWANVVSRVEFRWDHDASGGIPTINNGSGNQTGGIQNNVHNAYSLALNLIYKF